MEIGPGVDYFVASYVSLGVGFSAECYKQTGLQPSGATVTYEVITFGGGPRVGFNLPIGSWVSFYPRAYLGASVRSFDEKSGRDANISKAEIVYVGLYAPLLLHIASHAFVGFGPTVFHDVVQKREDSAAAADSSFSGQSSTMISNFA